MTDIGYYDGQIGPIDTLKAPITDRALYFGDGVYDAAVCQNGRLFALDEHLDRFYDSLRLLRIPAPMEKSRLSQLLCDLAGRVDPAHSYLCYWQASRGAAPRSHAFPKNSAPKLMAFIQLMPLDDVKKPMRLITVPDTRFLHCNIKTLNLIPNVMAYQQAVEHGCDEVVFHRDGRVTEGAHSGIAMFRGGVFCTPPLDAYILPSITRKHCLQLCEQLGIPTSQQPFTLEELMTADEVLVLSTGCMGAPVASIDGCPVGGRAPQLLGQLQRAYWKKYTQQMQL
ncbi:D-alanine aminotransferase [Anaerotruncus sp. 2789STDY5834896]|uniref:D-alanine aminotransferase n=1 Tax=uncultured Anaerotruncus sp. TaxID=905011 RepID=A0A1C6J3D3_9FIRM|nr:D-alanine aminotransferase [uncultured Anaerotruncus sp.]